MLMQQSQHEAAAQIKSPNPKIKDSGDHSDFFGFQEPSSKKNGSESKKIANSTVDESEWDDFRLGNQERKIIEVGPGSERPGPAFFV